MSEEIDRLVNTTHILNVNHNYYYHCMIYKTPSIKNTNRSTAMVLNRPKSHK